MNSSNKKLQTIMAGLNDNNSLPDQQIEVERQTEIQELIERHRKRRHYRSCWSFSSYGQIICAALFLATAAILIASIVGPIALEKAKDVAEQLRDPYVNVQYITSESVSHVISDKTGLVIIDSNVVTSLQMPSTPKSGRFLVIRNIGAIVVFLDVSYIQLGSPLTNNVVAAYNSISLYATADGNWIRT